MQIITWNVNGIRSVYRKGFLDWLKKEMPDILCLQEIRAKKKQLPAELKMEKDNLSKEYFAYFNPAFKKGYSGTAIYTKKKPDSIKTKIGLGRFDQQGRILIADYSKFQIVNAYMPHGGRNKEKLDFKLDAYEKLIDYLKKNKNKNKILCGDFNIARDKRDLARPEDNKDNIMFTPEERDTLKKILDLGFCDIFRSLHPETKKYSWFPYMYNAKERNLGWRIDYIMATKKICAKTKKASIDNQIDMSDHCPVKSKIQN